MPGVHNKQWPIDHLHLLHQLIHHLIPIWLITFIRIFIHSSSSLVNGLCKMSASFTTLFNLYDEFNNIHWGCIVCLWAYSRFVDDSLLHQLMYIWIDKHTLMSSQWFTWCRLCRHGGHAEHVSNWFAMNQQCPIAKCLCRCTLIDGIFC